MRKYKISINNQAMVNGLINKFLKSCSTKGDRVYAGKSMVTRYMDCLGRIRKGRLVQMDTELAAKSAIPVLLGDVVHFYGGNRVMIRSSSGESFEFIRDTHYKHIINKLGDIVWNPSVLELPPQYHAREIRMDFDTAVQYQIQHSIIHLGAGSPLS